MVVSELPLSMNSVHLLSHAWLFVTPWTVACQASVSINNSRSLLKFMSIESVMPFNHLILCYPLLLLPSIFPSIRVFSTESVLCIRWPKNWSFSFSISPSNEYSGLISFRIDLDRYTLLYLKWITNRDPRYSIRNCAQWQPGWGRMDTCIRMGETLHCSCETTTTLLIGYTPTQNKKLKKT